MELVIRDGRLERFSLAGFSLRRPAPPSEPSTAPPAEKAAMQPIDARVWHHVREPFTGAWQRNQELRVESLLANPTIYACMTRIAGDVAKCRPKLVELGPHGIWTEIHSSAFSPVLRRPNHFQNRLQFFEWWVISKLGHGNTYVLKRRDNRGVTVGAYVLDPSKVTPLISPGGLVFYQLDADNLSGVPPGPDGLPVTVPQREMMHDRMCPLFHPLCGLPPIFAAALAARLSLRAMDTAADFFQNGPGGVLTAPGFISDETAKRVQEYWETNFKGENAGRVAVLGDGLKYDAMSVNAVESQLVDQLRLTDEQIARCYHMPPWKVGIGNLPTGPIESLNLQYYTDCLQGHLEPIELVLDDGLGLTDRDDGREMGVEFDIDDLARMDTASLIKSEKEATGIKQVNESRKRLGLPPVEGGDTVYVQQQYYSLEALAKRDAAEGAPPSPVSNPAQQAAALEEVGTKEIDRLLLTKAAALATRYATEIRHAAD